MVSVGDALLGAAALSLVTLAVGVVLGWLAHDAKAEYRAVLAARAQRRELGRVVQFPVRGVRGE